TLEAQPAPGAPIAPPNGVERARSKRSGQEFNPSDHYPLPHNSCSSNRTEPTALLIAVKFPGRRKNPTSVSISSTAAR
ncbi:AGAP012458-PA, partial [Anopheles gambiae str. PEST]